MDEPIIKKLGNVSAYLDAVAHGYQGTREEFGEYLANCGRYSQETYIYWMNAAQSASDAQLALQNMMNVHFQMDEDGHVHLINGDLLGDVNFELLNTGHLEVTL